MDSILEMARSAGSELARSITILVESPWWPLVMAIIAFLTMLIALWAARLAWQQYRLQRKAAKAASYQDEELRLHDFVKEDFVAASKGYLVPYCSNVDPSDRDDLRNTVAVRERVFESLVRELAADERKHILVLADSGMGKTTLLLNLVTREQKNFRFALVHLGQSGALDRIKAIPAKRDTILLLDAFDEDPRAIEDAAGRMAEVMESASAFKCVVMTCRTQFFPSDRAIPNETGVKRFAARRAGVSAVYKWMTVYLLPFDRVQIDEYMRRAVPWFRRGQRIKARRIVSDISDLAARPMLTALIPSLAASKREAHSLWDLYAFMVDTWIQRESGWINPERLRNSSKVLAVQLVQKRDLNGSERISREDLVPLLCEDDSDGFSWKFTSRSLLNRDADGFYKFAHRSILEFFFILAFIEGDRTCLGSKWSDMMCDLFLSWGSSAQANADLAARLLTEDFRETGLFPIVDRHPDFSRIDISSVESVFSTATSIGLRSKFPASWRSAVGYVVRRDGVARAYDIADGLVWQIDVSTDIESREDRRIVQYRRSSFKGVDVAHREWRLADLYDLKLLCDILSNKNVLFDLMDERELYWLAVYGDEAYALLARVRAGREGAALDYPGLELLHSGSGTAVQPYTMDIYRVSVRSKAAINLYAMTVLVHYGDAERVLAEDKGPSATTWGIERELSRAAN